MTDAPGTVSTATSARSRRRLGIAAIVVAGLASAMVMQQPTWAPMSYLIQVEALSQGTAKVDSTHWQSGDVSWIGGHFYSNKAPGMPLLVLPEYLLLDAVGFVDASKDVFEGLSPKRQGMWRLAPQGWQFGWSRTIGNEQTTIRAGKAPQVWALGLLGTVIPAILLMLLARAMAERLEPGTGTAAALSLGLGTMALPFTSQLFGHVLSSLLLFAAFFVGFVERRREPDMRLVAASGVLLALAATVEFPTAFGGAIVGLWVVLRRGGAGSFEPGMLARRALMIGVAGVAGLVPLLLFDTWAFGSPTIVSYHNAIAVLGRTGHDRVGLISNGFWGIGLPHRSAFAELLVGPRGLFVATPVLAVAVAGLVAMWRRGLRGEVAVIAAVIAVFLTYVAGCWWPAGGLVPGPRYLLPMLPFLAVGLALAWRRLPSTTLAMSLVGFTVMLFATLTHPLVDGKGVAKWWTWFESRRFAVTVFEAFAGVHGSAAVVPVVLMFAAAIVLGASGTARLAFRSDLKVAAGALAGWAVMALVVSPHVGETVSGKVLPVSGIPKPIALIALAVATVGVVLAAAFRNSASTATEPTSS